MELHEGAGETSLPSVLAVGAGVGTDKAPLATPQGVAKPLPLERCAHRGSWKKLGTSERAGLPTAPLMLAMPAMDGIPGMLGMPGMPGMDGMDGIPGMLGTPGIPGMLGMLGTLGTPDIPGALGALGTPDIPGMLGTPG
mmetsp:Transcript_106517/g.254301  ORF Transcript_106517/g.254301 Transcript_106517/m.254301 type:complete len:139 (-) Transcript_106517:47-463(-)